MRCDRRRWIGIVAAAAVVGCSAVSEKWDRFLEGTEPDRPAPTVPPPPLGPDEAAPGPRVVVLSLPGLSADDVERGMRDGLLPGFRHLRTRGTYARLVEGATDAAAADAALLTATEPAGVVAPFARAPVEVPDLGRSISVARPVDAGGTTVSAAGRIAAAGRRVEIVRAHSAFAPGGARSLFGGAWPTLGTGTAPYTLAIERDAPGEPVVSPGGVRVAVVSPTGDAERDVFLIDVYGPPRLRDGFPSTARLRVTATKDRARASVIGADDRVELQAGRWSRPMALRFELGEGAPLHGRARLYLRPTGSGRLELYVEPPDFDPTRPPPWQPLSSPPEFVRELAGRVETVPRFSDPLPAAALRDGVLSVGDAAARIEAAFEVERATFERELLGGDFDLLFQSFGLAEQAGRLVSGDDDAPVVFFGLRVPRHALGDAAAGRLDSLVRSALLVADSGRLGPAVSVVVVGGTGPGAWFAIDRRGADLRSTSLADVGALPAALLGVPLPRGVTGWVNATGEPMEPLPEVELRRTPKEEAELPSEFDLRGR